MKRSEGIVAFDQSTGGMNIVEVGFIYTIGNSFKSDHAYGNAHLGPKPKQWRRLKTIAIQTNTRIQGKYNIVGPSQIRWNEQARNMIGISPPMVCTLVDLKGAVVCIGLASTTGDLRLLSHMRVYFRVKTSTDFWIDETTYCLRLHAFGNTIPLAREDECPTRTEGRPSGRRHSMQGKIWRERWGGACWVRILRIGYSVGVASQDYCCSIIYLSFYLVLYVTSDSHVFMYENQQKLRKPW